MPPDIVWVCIWQIEAYAAYEKNPNKQANKKTPIPQNPIKINALILTPARHRCQSTDNQVMSDKT